MNMNSNITFNEYCNKYLGELYDPKFPEEKQCNGYKQLKKMVVEGITPASLEEVVRWRDNPTIEELLSIPDLKYLNFLHPLLRVYVIEDWEIIKTLKL